MMGWIRNGLGALALAALVALVLEATGFVRAEAETTMAVSVNGRAVTTLTPGVHIGVVVRGLPVLASRGAYCLGLASAIDRYSLPVSLGRVARDAQGTGRIVAIVPPRLFPAEPTGPYLLFIGTCTPIAPDRPFVARTTIRIVPN